MYLLCWHLKIIFMTTRNFSNILFMKIMKYANNINQTMFVALNAKYLYVYCIPMFLRCIFIPSIIRPQREDIFFLVGKLMNQAPT